MCVCVIEHDSNNKQSICSITNLFNWNAPFSGNPQFYDVLLMHNVCLNAGYNAVTSTATKPTTKVWWTE